MRKLAPFLRKSLVFAGSYFAVKVADWVMN